MKSNYVVTLSAFLAALHLQTFALPTGDPNKLSMEAYPYHQPRVDPRAPKGENLADIYKTHQEVPVTGASGDNDVHLARRETHTALGNGKELIQTEDNKAGYVIDRNMPKHATGFRPDLANKEETGKRRDDVGGPSEENLSMVKRAVPNSFPNITSPPRPSSGGKGMMASMGGKMKMATRKVKGWAYGRTL
jgi:hypothetical protein